MKTILWTAPVALLAMGCEIEVSDDKSDDTGDIDSGVQVEDTAVDFYDGETTIDDVVWDCDPASYWYDIYTVGWTGGGWLDIHQTAVTDYPWTEEHWLDSYDWADDGSWDNLYLELAVLDTEANPDAWKDQEANITTLYQCDDDMIATMSFRVTVYEYDDPTDAADCVAWGHDATYYTDAGDCQDWS